jgi:bifunctional oligoribonuclease and PAP phosphatase NrnA
MNKNDLQQAAKLLADGRSFVLAGHVNPDGDCLGSMCALALSLKMAGKDVLVIAPDDIPENYRFLPCSDEISNELPVDRRFDVCIIVDSDRPSRLGAAEDVLSLASSLLVIDHHKESQWDSGVQLIDCSSASCGDIVFDLLTEAGFPITEAVANSLMTAIITDTGSFRFSNVTPLTFRRAASLIEAGASVPMITQQVFDSRPLSYTKLLAHALSSLVVTNDGEIAYMALRRSDFREAGAEDSETEGIVNYARTVRGVEVALLFREMDDDTVRVSLRSAGTVDVSDVAQSFGGGGHRVASGCTVNAPFEQAVNLVLNAVRTWTAS